MSNLKPLVWEDEAGSAMTTTIFRGYWATSDAESKDKFCVHYGSSKGEPARGFGSLEDAKNWAEHEHYANEMQPYVKSSPTWIDVNKRLPKEDGLYLVYYPDQPYKQRIIFFSSNINKFNLFHDLITHWMLLPESPVSEEVDCE